MAWSFLTSRSSFSVCRSLGGGTPGNPAPDQAAPIKRVSHTWRRSILGSPEAYKTENPETGTPAPPINMFSQIIFEFFDCKFVYNASKTQVEAFFFKLLAGHLLL